MHTYTLDEARGIVMHCAKQYEKNLLSKCYLVIYRDRTDNEIKDIEIYFGEENYQHLTGIELIDEDQFRKDGTTNLKLAALPVIMQIQKVTKIAGNYNGRRPSLIADKLIGNVNFCLGLKRDNKQGGYVPSSSLLEDIKVLTDAPSQVLAIFSKEDGEEVYRNVRRVAKGVNLNNIELPERIDNKITLETYMPKVCKKVS